MRPKRSSVAWLSLAVALAPATALASEKSDLAGKWGGAAFVGDAVLLLAIGFGFAAVGLNRIGMLLWILLVTAAGGVFVMGMSSAPIGEPWQWPALIGGAALFAFAAERARRRLAEE